MFMKIRGRQAKLLSNLIQHFPTIKKVQYYKPQDYHLTFNYILVNFGGSFENWSYLYK